MIVGVIRQRTVKDAIAEIKNGEKRGARGFDLHLDALDEEFRTVESIQQICEATERPILALNYKNGYFGPLTMTEEERIELLMVAVDAGVSAVDLQGYSFDDTAKLEFVDAEHVPEELEFLKELKPNEVALKPEVLEKQRRFIEKVHEKGAEVLLSMHLGVHLTTDQLLALSQFVRRTRNMDAIKLVTPCASEQQLAECLYSTVILKQQLDFPFVYHAAGKMGMKSRMICPMLGSYMMFCNVDYGYSSNFEQLHLESMAEAYRLMDV